MTTLEGHASPAQLLLEEVQSRHLHPEDPYEIAALLESMGWNDQRAAAQFGTASIFDLAEMLWGLARDDIDFQPSANAKRPHLIRTVTSLVQQFARGVIFALPMALSIVAMLTLRFSLWSYQNLAVSLATAIAIGTILSFVTVGGFTQAIARRGFYYVFQGYYGMARKVTFHFIGIGLLVASSVCVLLFVLNFLVNLFPISMALLMIVYYFVLNSIWLSVTVMYILRKEIVFTGLILIGIGFVYLFYRVLHWNILVSQIISMMLVSVASMAIVLWLFYRAERKAERGIQPKLPRLSVTVYSTMPYFVYGIVYFCFLFADRLVAWSANQGFMPYVVWFRGDYELGLDFALLTLILPMGISEVIVTKFMNDVSVSQRQFLGTDTDIMNRGYIRRYWRYVVLMFAAAIANAAFVYWGTQWIINRYLGSFGTRVEINGQVNFVFLWALFGYAFVAVALLNAVVLFSLSQPERVLRSVLPAMVVNIVIGFLLSRWVGYDWAVLGLAAGAVVFTVLTTVQVRQVLARLDYHLYFVS